MEKVSLFEILIIVVTLVIFGLISLKRLPLWYLWIFLFTFGLCLIGWELWMSFGLINGDSVHERSNKNNTNNLILMCLGDAIIGVLQVFLAIKICGKDSFKKWNWKAFGVIFLFGIVQNIIVTILLYKQLANKSISSAPMMPIKMNAPLMVQQPWILQPFLLYPVAMFLINS